MSETLDHLIAQLKNDSLDERERAIKALGHPGNAHALEKLLPLFDETRPYYLLATLTEVVGRIGDPRALSVLTPEMANKHSYRFNTDIRMSWAIANIGAQAKRPAIQQQAARALVRMFPPYQLSNRYLLHRLPWEEASMLDSVACLLGDSDQEIRVLAAIFLGLHGDRRSSDMLIECLRFPERFGFESVVGKLYYVAQALVVAEERQAVDIYLELLSLPNPPEHAARDLYIPLERWGDTLTPDERRRFTESVPKICAYLTRGDVNPYFVTSIRAIKSEEANRIVDEWLNEEIYHLFASFIEQGDPSGVPTDIGGLYLIARGYQQPDAGILTHPLMRRYAFPALRARYADLLSRKDTFDLNTLIAIIGWLGDPNALPFLYEELERCEQDDPANLFGEIICAIANIGSVESVPVLLNYLQHNDPSISAEAEYVLRFFIEEVPDAQLVQAIFAHLESEESCRCVELIEAIGKGGSPIAVPGLVRFLARRDEECSEAISALVQIVRENPGDAELARKVVSHLKPLLNDQQPVALYWVFHPLYSMNTDHFTALALKDIGTPEALAAVEAWRRT